MLSKLEKQIVAAAMEKFGCNSRESAVYLQVLQMGASSVRQISDRLKMNRVTTHCVIEQLILKGLLFETKEGARRRIEAHTPEVFKRLAEERSLAAKTLELSAVELQNILRQSIPINTGAQRLEYYEGIEGYKRMLMRTLEAKGEFLAIINTQLFADLLGQTYLLRFFKVRAEKGISSRLILPKVDFAKVIKQKEKEFKIQVKTITSGFLWTAGVISWNDCLSIKSFSEKHLSCSIITNQEISDLFRKVIFENLWQIAEDR